MALTMYTGQLINSVVYCRFCILSSNSVIFKHEFNWT